MTWDALEAKEIERLRLCVRDTLRVVGDTTATDLELRKAFNEYAECIRRLTLLGKCLRIYSHDDGTIHVDVIQEKRALPRRPSEIKPE